MSITLIAAVSDNNVIGVNNQLPWKIPFDFAWFRMNTLNAVVIMGRKTWDSLPKKPLEKRVNVVISRTKHMSEYGEVWCTSFEKALYRYRGKRIFIIGGEQIYRQAISRVERAIITRVHTTIVDSNAKKLFLPYDFRKIWTSGVMKHKKWTFHFEILSF